MLPIALFSWWYTTAWTDLAHAIERRFRRALEFFSVGLLMRTLFDPYRQIAAVKGSNKGAIDAQFRAWTDRSFSRMIGAVVRSIFIVTGGATAGFVLIIGFFQMVVWPCIPLLPLIAVAGLVSGWSL